MRVLFIICIGAPLLALYGCGKDEATGARAPDASAPVTTGTCEGYTRRLEACGMIDRPIDCSVAAVGREVVECQYACFEAADCAAIRAAGCFGLDNPFAACVTACESFLCEDGKQIPVGYQCDGFVDCASGEDELECPRCDNGALVSPSEFCDGFPHCVDGSDEAECPEQPTWQCGSGETVPGEYRCDGLYVNCADGSDERDCATLLCPQPPAVEHGAACAKAAEKLMTCGLLPDGVIPDCADRTEFLACQKTCVADADCSALESFFCSDTAEDTRVTACLEGCRTRVNYYPCASGDEFVHANAVCNRFHECADQSDELECGFSCGPDQITLPLYAACDGREDCEGGQDEVGCIATCPPVVD